MKQVQIFDSETLSTGLRIDSIRAFDDEQATRIVNRDPWALTIMAVVSTLNPSSASLEGWGRYFPQNTTTVIESIEPASKHPAMSAVAMLSTSELIQDALRYLGLTKTQLKDICAVSRQTLYDWLSGKFEPDPANAKRLRAVHELALLVPQYSRYPIRAAMLTRPIIGKASLLEMLQRPQLDMPLLHDAVIAVANRSGAQEKRSARSLRERLGFRKLDNATQKANLDDNIEDLETI